MFKSALCGGIHGLRARPQSPFRLQAPKCVCIVPWFAPGWFQT